MRVGHRLHIQRNPRADQILELVLVVAKGFAPFVFDLLGYTRFFLFSMLEGIRS